MIFYKIKKTKTHIRKRRTMKKHLILTLSAILIAGALGACSNTVHGAGEDIENAGEAVQSNVPPKN